MKRKFKVGDKVYIPPREFFDNHPKWKYDETFDTYDRKNSVVDGPLVDSFVEINYADDVYVEIAGDTIWLIKIKHMKDWPTAPLFKESEPQNCPMCGYIPFSTSL